MPYPKKDSDSTSGTNAGRIQNGTRQNFRTDTAISSNRSGNERVLKRWVPDAPADVDGSLEKSTGGATWDQFAENERLFGLTTDYNENIYTTTIDRSHPQYKERVAAADKKAREIERSVATTSHVAEERIMDHAGGKDRDGDEEDKYSGVRRQDFPPLGGRENKYTPPAKRAPSGQVTVTGAPVDPAIISSQLRAPSNKQPPSKPEEGKQNSASLNKAATPAKSESAKPPDSNTDSTGLHGKTPDVRATEPKQMNPAVGESKEKNLTPSRASGSSSKALSPQVKDGTPSATSTVERDVLNSFKTFANQQRINAEKARTNKAKADKEEKLTELKKFADTFKLSTPVPNDLIGIIAKDPVKQKEIQAKALMNAEEVAKAKSEPKDKDKETANSQLPAKSPLESISALPPADAKGHAPRPPAPHAQPPSNMPNRQPAARQSYAPSQFHGQPYRNDRANAPQISQQGRPTGTLGHRLRNVEQQKLSQPPPQHVPIDVRLPPTGPANNGDAAFARRLSQNTANLGNKLNPNSHEFRPSAFAPAFNPSAHPSTSSSPRSAVNQTADTQANATPTGLIRRKTKAVDVKKCYILAHVKTFHPPQGRNWEDNDGLRPSYDTLPTWRQLQEENERPDSTMRLTYRQYFERNPFAGPTLSTPNPVHVVPQIPHQHQLPLHLQQGSHAMAPRQSPHMPPMQMHTPQHGHAHHVGYGNADDHRMMHSNSAQSFASPRMAPVPVAYPPMSSPAPVPFTQPVMQPYVAGNAPQMGQYRSFSNNAQYMPQQQGHIAAPIMMQPQFVTGPQGMVGATPQMQMYPGGQPQFIPPGGAPPQPIPGSNGYPSPGRPAAQMMVHQGSQQGQPVYGMSPSIPYQQPVYVAQQGHMRGYGSPGPQHYGTSPQQMHQYGTQHRGGSGAYGHKNFPNHGHQMAQPSHVVPSGPRVSDGPEEGK